MIKEGLCNYRYRIKKTFNSSAWRQHRAAVARNGYHKRMFHVKQQVTMDMNEKLKPFLSRAKKCYEVKELERLGLSPDLEQREMILTYISLLLKWNPAVGLISPRDENGLFLRHFCDSIQPLLLFGFKKDARILDIGAGGGFPSIPTRVFRPDLTFDLVEANRKKAAFLTEVKEELKLDTMTIYNIRTEKMAKPPQGYDYVISRAVGSLIKFAHTAKPFMAPDGRLYRSESWIRRTICPATRAAVPRCDSTQRWPRAPISRANSGSASNWRIRSSSCSRFATCNAALCSSNSAATSGKSAMSGPNTTGLPAAAGSMGFCPPLCAKLPPTNATSAIS